MEKAIKVLLWVHLDKEVRIKLKILMEVQLKRISLKNLKRINYKIAIHPQLKLPKAKIAVLLCILPPIKIILIIIIKVI